MASYEVAVFFFTTENTEEEVFKIFLKPYVHKVLFDFSLRVAFGFSVVSVVSVVQILLSGSTNYCIYNLASNLK